MVIGDILVRTLATKFKKLKFNTHENVGYGEIDLPPEEMHTRSVVLLFSPDSRAGVSFSNQLFQALRLLQHPNCLSLYRAMQN